MRRYLELYRRLMSVHLRSQMQYRLSFVAELIGNFLVTGLDFIAIVVLLQRFDAIGGWTLPEVMFLYGASTVSFSLAEFAAGAFDDFDAWVVNGEFDRVLIRPLPVVFQMIAGALPLRRLGRLTQGIAALAVALTLLDPIWRLGDWLFLGVMLAGGAAFFLAIFITGASAAFWTPQTGELTNIFTYGGAFMTSYPMHIYQAWMRSLFTFVIPLAFINYYPALHLLRRPDPAGLPVWTPYLAPLVAAAALTLSLRLWHVGVRHYQSTGS